MKKKVLLNHLSQYHCYPTGQQKGSHAKFRNTLNGQVAIVPMHNDIDEMLARKICKELRIPPVKFN